MEVKLHQPVQNKAIAGFLLQEIQIGACVSNVLGETLCTLEKDSEVTGNYTCPGADHPKANTECCPTPGMEMKGCCPRARYFYEIDRTLASTIVIVVVCVCVAVALVFALCCFWSKCPLFLACKVEFTHDIATYESKDDNIHLDTMPTEFSIKSTNKFSPVVVSNGNLPLGAEAM
ncbi:hypothetical protein JTE90_005923 [Oedothorax gibbosus]|uniref:Uncharacterized protein n=1 Tax=Oedothorax gibbosus TaxID=931172 RepID=A0AAV6UB29_9ARAC|nr:hypothetical protein JTE90_005923 [Oedothorax gibbosus]